VRLRALPTAVVGLDAMPAEQVRKPGDLGSQPTDLIA
jgi:hypothetical protein